MNAGVLAKFVEAGACAPGCKLVTWPWSVAFAAAKAASWDSSLIIGSTVAAMLAACRPLVLTMVDMTAVDSTKESQWLWLRVDGSSEESRQRLWLRVDGTLEESQTAALVAIGRLFGRELNSGSEVVGSLEERTAETWVGGVVDSSEESRQRFLSTNPMEVDTLRPSTMLNIYLKAQS